MKTNAILALMLGAGWQCHLLRAQDISDVFPELKTLPAPASIQEGLRINYYGSVGDIPKDDYSKWTTNSGNWEYATAPSAHGYTQVDVLALSQGRAILSVQAWQYSDWTGPLVPIRGGQSGLICYAGGGDWWIHPQVLAKLQEVYTEDFAILRVNYLLEGNVYRAVRVQRVLPESRQAVIYDLDTGRLLFKNIAVQTANTTFVSQMYFRGTRPLPFTGGGTRIPSWIKPELQLDYQGTYTAYVFGNPPYHFPLEALVRIQSVGDRWFSYEQTTTLGGPNGNVSKALLVGGGGNIYIAPGTLRALPLGAVLDTDPITGAELKVAEKGASVTLRVTVGTFSRTDLIFDAASGLMTAFGSLDSTDPLYGIETRVDLVQMPQVNAAHPHLSIARQDNAISLVCEDAGTRQFTLEASENGQPWQTVGQLIEGEAWKSDFPAVGKYVLYRLRL